MPVSFAVVLMPTAFFLLFSEMAKQRLAIAHCCRRFVLNSSNDCRIAPTYSSNALFAFKGLFLLVTPTVRKQIFFLGVALSTTCLITRANFVGDSGKLLFSQCALCLIADGEIIPAAAAGTRTSDVFLSFCRVFSAYL